jgi:uncharacterized RDD family membrane protein YckC
MAVFILQAAWFVYAAFAIASSHEATPGMRLLKMRVVRQDTLLPLNLRQALTRSLWCTILTWANALIFVTIAIDGLWPLWSPRHQALHDVASRSLVIGTQE